MLDCERPPPQVCPHCHDNSHSDHQKYWGISLDQDLFETIFSWYPEWFSELTAMEEDRLLLLGGSASPPQAIVDQTSLHSEMDRNKESLKVKLLLRRPIAQLVDQGIMPSLKAPPHFHEQRQKLERAKMGDILKNKIQKRPDRQQLIKQHILEDTSVDPSLQDKQRQLKKARLADDLNDRLSHRPGPLELIKGNILQTDEKFAQAVKEGQIHFKRTCEGQTLKHPSPRFVIEEDSNSDTALSPSQQDPPSFGADSPSFESVFVASQSSPAAPTIAFSPHHTSKSKKKPKPKAPTTKTRTIKFHEYKGPPSAQKQSNTITTQAPPQATITTSSNSNSGCPSETSYDLLLQQQQLFLQWQLEWNNKYPQIILSPVSASAQVPSPTAKLTAENASLVTTTASSNPTTTTNDQCPPPDSTTPSSTYRPAPSKLEDMKVSDLKAELKRRNLPVSGSKPQLIERLKPYSEPASAPSPVPMEVESTEDSKEQLVRLQQKKIEKLQQELQRSQLKLQQQQQQQLLLQQHQQHHPSAAKSILQPQTNGSAAASQAVKANLAAFLQSHHHQQQLQQQQSHHQVPTSLEGSPTPHSIVFYPASVNSLIDVKPTATAAVSLLHNRASSLPNFTILSPQVVLNKESSPLQQPQQAEPQPPTYTEATKANSNLARFLSDDLLNCTVSTSDVNKSAQCQAIDDVIEILIKNGELPPSAALSQDAAGGHGEASPPQLEIPDSPVYHSSATGGDPDDGTQTKDLFMDATATPVYNNNNNNNTRSPTPLEFQLGLDMEAMDIGLERPAALFDPLDMELSDFLAPTPTTTTVNASHPAPSSCTPSQPRLHDPDPLLSATPFDFFSLVEEMEFNKATPPPPQTAAAVLNWDYNS